MYKHPHTDKSLLTVFFAVQVTLFIQKTFQCATYTVMPAKGGIIIDFHASIEPDTHCMGATYTPV